jgi:arginase
MASMADHSTARVVVVPYDSGHRGVRMGAGPKHLLENGLAEALGSVGRRVRSHAVHPEGDPPAEVAAAFELDRIVSGEVRRATAEGEFPLVLSGNCNASVGTIAGAGPEGLGVVWFDGHADFNTPETTATGFTDGMGLDIAVGHCWKRMAGGVPGFSAVPEENVVLAGVREVEPAERDRLAASRVTGVGADLIVREGLGVLAEALDGLRGRAERAHVHLDLDVLDPGKVGKANEFAPEGGLDAEELLAALRMVLERFAVASFGIASYDPAFDADDWVRGAALACVGLLASPAAGAFG